MSDKPVPHAYSLIEQTSIANNLITKLNIKHCHIIAHDYGDSVAQSLLHKYENKELSFTIDSICYLNGGLFAESHRPLLTQKLLKSKLGPFITKFMNKNSLRRSFKKIYNPAKPPSNQDIDCIWLLLNHNNGIAALHYLLGYIDERHLHRNNWVNSMQNTRVMQYFVNGMHDPISGQHMLDKFEKLVPNANAVGIDAGHYPQLESPDLINTIYLEFLNRVLSKAQSADI